MRDTWIITELCSSNGRVDGITMDDSGYIYFTDDRENIYRVHRDNMQRNPRIIMDITGARLCGIVWNRNGNTFYVCDVLQNRIMKYSPGKLSPLVGDIKISHQDGNFKVAGFHFPSGITMDPNGDLYITEPYHIRKINLSEGTVITIAGSDGPGHKDGEANQAKFGCPSGLVVSDSTIYVADTDNHCIRKIKDGIVSTIAGTPGVAGYLDGQLSQSLFETPCAIVLDADRNLLVADDNGIRKVDLNKQIVSTLKRIFQVVISLYQDGHTMFVGVSHQKSLWKLECSWKWERFLWIGNRKESSSYCHLASLPKDIIIEIANYMRSPLKNFPELEDVKMDYASDEDPEEEPTTKKHKTC